MRHLPPEIAKLYKDAILRPDKWSIKSENPRLMARLLDSTEEAPVKERTTIFSIKLTPSVLNQLDGGSFNIKSMWAIYNPTLVHTFCLTKEKLANRAQSDPALFFSQTAWKKDAGEKELTLREWTIEVLNTKLNLFSWNKIQAVN